MLKTCGGDTLGNSGLSDRIVVHFIALQESLDSQEREILHCAECKSYLKVLRS